MLLLVDLKKLQENFKLSFLSFVEGTVCKCSNFQCYIVVKHTNMVSKFVI